jgi:hypothetical protein
MLRRPLSSLKLKQADIEQMEAKLEEKRQPAASDPSKANLPMEVDPTAEAEITAKALKKE